VTGTRPEEIERLGALVVNALRSMPSTRNAFIDPIGRGSYLDVNWNRAALARAGVTIEEAQEAIEYAVGGRNVTTVLHGRERIPVNVRYAADPRADRPSLERTFAFGERSRRPVPIGDLASIRDATGPVMLRNDDGLLTAYVYVDIIGRDYANYVAEAARRISDEVKFPVGYSFSWTGQYEEMLRTRRQLTDVIPLTILLVAVLLYISTRSLTRTLFVLLAVPFSAIGAIWAIYLLGYPVSVAVWVGVIALLGIDAETGVFMLLYLDQAYDRMTREGRLNGLIELEDAILQGAARRVRPKVMTVLTMLVGLVPIMWSTGTGSEVMKRIAAPLVGGIITSFALELVVYPILYFRWRSRELRSGGSDRPDTRVANPSSPGQTSKPHVAVVRYSV
jgi:Cu(I)/Ag(I) efflux system membrane protein CusA/SilA